MSGDIYSYRCQSFFEYLKYDILWESCRVYCSNRLRTLWSTQQKAYGKYTSYSWQKKTKKSKEAVIQQQKAKKKGNSDAGVYKPETGQ